MAISSSQAVYGNCATNHTLYFTVVFKLCSPNCSSFLCPVPRLNNSLLSAPNTVVSSLPIISFLPCVYRPCIFLRSLPLREHWAHLISISSLHHCYKINHHHINLFHSWDKELDYGRRSALHLDPGPPASTPVPLALCFHCECSRPRMALLFFCTVISTRSQYHFKFLLYMKKYFFAVWPSTGTGCPRRLRSL